MSQDEGTQSDAEVAPELLDLAEQISASLRAGEPVSVADFVNRYPQWAGEIRSFVPTDSVLIDSGRARDRERPHEHRLINMDKESIVRLGWFNRVGQQSRSGRERSAV